MVCTYTKAVAVNLAELRRCFSQWSSLGLSALVLPWKPGVNAWHRFGGKPGLMRRAAVHPALVSRIE